jgi:hypothetical protein
MSVADDYEHEMFGRFDLDDDTIDVILSGRDPGRPDVAMLVAFVEDARSVTRRPAPTPSAPLAAILAEGLSTEQSDLAATAASNVRGTTKRAAGLPKWRKKTLAAAQLLTGLSLGAKAALGIGVAAAAVTGAGAAGALPDAAQHAVASTLSTVTPFEFPDNADTPDNANTHADFGQTTSSDATGQSDGRHGVDGQSIASNAAENGLSVASDTPAGDHVPSSLPPEAPRSHGAEAGESGESNASTEVNSQSSNAPEDPGSQSSNGIDTAASTPAGDHVPPQLPRARL